MTIFFVIAFFGIALQAKDSFSSCSLCQTTDTMKENNCESCHVTHSFEHTQDLSPPYSLKVTLPPAFAKKILGGKMQCTTCHEPLKHGTDTINPHANSPAKNKQNKKEAGVDCTNLSVESTLRGGPYRTAGELCLNCHLGIKEQINAFNPHYLHRDSQLANKNGACSQCHDVAVGQAPTEKQHPLKNEPQKLCETCHARSVHALSEAHLGKTIPIQSDANRPREASPGEITCLSCHSPHIKSEIHALNLKIAQAEQKESRKKGSLSFQPTAKENRSPTLRMEGNINALCSSCHAFSK